MLTVVIASKNGARTLPGLFKALEKIIVPSCGWKIVFADNGSTDETPAIVERFGASLPITYVVERRQGKNAAENTALERVEGDLVVFTDDDTIPERDWLVSLRAVADQQPEFSLFGGQIIPRWERGPDEWILKEVDAAVCYTATDPAEPEGPCHPVRVWGPNMAIRRSLFDEGHRFDESVGPSGSSYAMGSETEFNTRVAKHGHRAWFCRAAVVHHFIRAHQLERAWILDRAIRFGRGTYLCQSRDEPKYDGPLLFGAPRFMVRRVAEQYLRVTEARLFDRSRSFAEHWKLNYLIGNLIEARRRLKGSSRGVLIGRTNRGLMMFISGLEALKESASMYIHMSI